MITPLHATEPTPGTTTAAQLALVDSLRDAMMAANALPGLHPYQDGGSYGAIRDALITTLVITLDNLGICPGDVTTRQRCATEVEALMVSSGEGVAFCLDLHRAGIRA